MKTFILGYMIMSSALFLGAGTTGTYQLTYRLSKHCGASEGGAQSIAITATGLITLGFAVGLIAAIIHF